MQTVNTTQETGGAGDLIENLQMRFEEMNKQTAEKLIEDIVQKP